MYYVYITYNLYISHSNNNELKYIDRYAIIIIIKKVDK